MLSSLAARRWSAAQAPGQWYGAVLVALVLVSKVDIRGRDPKLALQGSVDTQIAVELGCWAIAGCWVALRLLQRRQWLFSAFPSRLGPALQVYLLIGTLSVLTAALAGIPLTLVRALQLLILLALGVLIQRDVSSGATRLVDVYTAAARTLVLAVILLAAVGALFPELTSVAQTYTGFSRYRLLQMHPIGSAQLLGLALVVAAVDLLVGLRPLQRLEHGFLMCASVGLAAGLWATKSRGALVATVVAVLVLVVLTPRARQRSHAVLLGALMAVPLVAGVFDRAVQGTLLRGQNTDELTSLTGRTELFAYAWELIVERPILGHGYLAGRGLFLERFPWAGESHNAVVDIAISLGLVGLLLYMLLIASATIPLARHVQAPGGHRRRQAAVGWALLAWLLLDGVVADSYGGAIGPGVLALLLAALFADDLRASPAHTRRTASRGRAVA